MASRDSGDQHAEWFVLGPDRKPYGPYSLRKLKLYAADGRLDATTYVLRRSTGAWIRAREIPGLFHDNAVVVHTPSAPATAVSRGNELATPGLAGASVERHRSVLLMLSVGLVAWALTITPSLLRYGRALKDSESARLAADSAMTPIRDNFQRAEASHSEIKERVAEAATRGERLFYFDPDGGVHDPVKAADEAMDGAKLMFNAAEGAATIQVAAALEREKIALDDLVNSGILGIGVGLAVAVVSLFARVLLLRL